MYRSFSLKSILTIFLTFVVTLSIILVGFISYRVFTSTMTEQIAKSRIDVLSQISERITALNGKLTVMSNFYHYNNVMLDYYDDNEYENNEIEIIIEKFNQIDRLSHETIKAIDMDFSYRFVLDNGFTYDSDKEGLDISLMDYEKELWYSNIIEANGSPVWISTYREKDSDDYQFSLARSITDPSTKEIIGISMFSANELSISKTYTNLIDDNEIYIVDSLGNILSHSDKQMIGINFYDMDVLDQLFAGNNYKIIKKNGEEYLFSKFSNTTHNWLLVEEIPLKIVLEPLNKIRNYMIGSGLLVFLLCLGIIITISSRTTAPLRTLCKQLEQIGGQEQADFIFDVKGWQEIDRICDECNQMNARILSLVKDVKKEASEKHDAEMGFLQSQINPHFLYNTLFSIKCMVDMGDKGKAIGIIDAFTAIMKYVLSYQEREIFIFEELKFIEDYIALQSYRYGDRFNFTMICDDEMLNYKILRMVIQPLIENAIFHGAVENERVVDISLTIKQDDKNTIVIVNDNGIGMSDEKMNSLWNSKDKDSQSNLIGMKNITNRIKLHYGDAYGLEVKSDVGIGVNVTVTIPK